VVEARYGVFTRSSRETIFARSSAWPLRNSCQYVGAGSDESERDGGGGEHAGRNTLRT